MKAGVDFSLISFQATTSARRSASWTFPRDAEYNANEPTTYPTQWINSLPTYAEIPVKHFAIYVQDDWQLAPRPDAESRAALRRAVRVVQRGPDGPARRDRRQAGPAFGSYPLPIPFHDGADQRGDRNNFGPRVGVAWDVTGDGRTNVHAGYGLFYDNMRTLQNFGELTWPQSRPIIISNPSFPDPLQGRSRDQFVSTAPPNITVMDNDKVSAYAHQFSAGVTRMIGRDFGVTADFIIVQRKSDRDTVDLNLPDQVTRVRPYPQFARVNYWQPTADNKYHALLLKFEKRMSNRYQFLGVVHAEQERRRQLPELGDVYGFFEVEHPGHADRRHRLVVSGIVQLPCELQVSAIADFRSSLPLNPTSGIDLNDDGYTMIFRRASGSGCRDLNLDAINTFRQGRNLTAVTDDRVPRLRQRRHPARKVVRFGRGSVSSSSRSSSTSPTAPTTTCRTTTSRPPRSGRRRRSCRTSTRRLGRSRSPCAIDSDRRYGWAPSSVRP